MHTLLANKATSYTSVVKGFCAPPVRTKANFVRKPSGRIQPYLPKPQTPAANESEMRQISNYALIFRFDYTMWEISDAPLDT